MKLKPIIESLLETDLYKFSMGQAIYHQFPDYKTTWTFKCRNTDVKFTAEMIEEIKEQIKAYCELRFTEEELESLDTYEESKEILKKVMDATKNPLNETEQGYALLHINNLIAQFKQQGEWHTRS